MPGGSLRVQARIHQSGLWVTVPLTIQGAFTIYPVIDTGSPASAVSPAVKAELDGRGLLVAARRSGRYVLSHLTTQDQALPDLHVGVLQRLGRLNIDALLGLDFLLQFTDVHFNVPSLTFTLVEP